MLRIRLLQSEQDDGSFRVDPDRTQETKIVPIRHFQGAFVYYGLAELSTQSTLEWLRAQARSARNFDSAERFAGHVTKELETEIGKMHFRKETDKGIGIHLSAYERIEGFKVPELFHITNFLDTSYRSIRPSGMRLTRETYCVMKGIDWAPEHHDSSFRMEVREFLQEQDQGMLIYNNGDPEMFNPIADVVLKSIGRFKRQGRLVDPTDPDTFGKLARRVVKIISKLQAEFVIEGWRLVGGKTHDWIIPVHGEPRSTTGG